MKYALKTKLNALLVLLLLSAILAGCTIVVRNDKPTKEEVVVVKQKGPYKKLGIPPGHLPPPGMCRIWFPGRPPGHQPKPGNCHRLSQKVPPGAWLLSRSESDPKHVQVTVFDKYDASEVVVIRYYIAETGQFAHEEKP